MDIETKPVTVVMRTGNKHWICRLVMSMILLLLELMSSVGRLLSCLRGGTSSARRTAAETRPDGFSRYGSRTYRQSPSKTAAG